jgi:hypothetical protein
MNISSCGFDSRSDHEMCRISQSNVATGRNNIFTSSFYMGPIGIDGTALVMESRTGISITLLICIGKNLIGEKSANGMVVAYKAISRPQVRVAA